MNNNRAFSLCLLAAALASPTPAAAQTIRPSGKEDIIVFKEPGRYGGWPANHGLCQP